MIEKMKKYSFLVYHKDYQSFLEELRTLGVLHIKTSEVEQSPENASRVAEIAKLNSTISELKLRIDDEQDEKSVSKTYSLDELHELVEKNTEAINNLGQDLNALKKDCEIMKPWGDYNPETFLALGKAGYNLHFYVCDKNAVTEELDKDSNFVLANSTDRESYYVKVEEPGGDDDLAAKYEMLEEVKLEFPYSYYKEKIVETEKQIDACEEELDTIAPIVVDSFTKEVNKLQQEINFTKAYNSGQKEAEGKIFILTGWVPIDDAPKFESEVSKQNTYFLDEDAPETDETPIKLKNNKFAKLFEVIGDLYTLPRQGELDLTPFFAPFYMLFFGFCLGDAGYGMLITLGTLFMMRKASEKVKPLLWLAFFLGVSTTIMGVIGGTAFGMLFGMKDGVPLHSGPAWFEKYQHFVLDSDNLMILSLLLGYIQVLFGMVLKGVNIIRQKGIKYAISQIGWIIIVGVAIPSYGLGAMDMVDSHTANIVCYASLVIGGLPALLYNSPNKNIFVNFGSGLWDSYGMASGLLGDVLSYIRLFALGLSSAILGNVFNLLAVDLSPDTIILRQLVMILILLFGHSLNIFMALLGSVVHPLRLTFVEFYKNAGFEGGGKKYEPFKQEE